MIGKKEKEFKSIAEYVTTMIPEQQEMLRVLQYDNDQSKEKLKHVKKAIDFMNPQKMADLPSRFQDLQFTFDEMDQKIKALHSGLTGDIRVAKETIMDKIQNSVLKMDKADEEIQD